MARKKMRRFARGGGFQASDEIIVRGKRPMDEISTFDLSRIGGTGGLGGGLGSGMGITGGTAVDNSQRVPSLPAPPMPTRDRMPVTPAVVRQPQSTLGDIAGARAPTGYGARMRMGFAEGGKAKAKPKPKKMAKGGAVSSASKRADGCATKGKTRGKMV